VRTLHCVEPLFGLVCSVVLIKCAKRSSSIMRAGPGRTTSYSPAMRRLMKRVRYLPTVCLVIFSRAAIGSLGSPSALVSTGERGC
jgi:hypothetical protein